MKISLRSNIYIAFALIFAGSLLLIAEAKSGTINLPGYFIKNHGQFHNNYNYCMKTANICSYFGKSSVTHQYVYKDNKNDSLESTVFNLRIDFEGINNSSTIEEKDV